MLVILTRSFNQCIVNKEQTKSTHLLQERFKQFSKPSDRYIKKEGNVDEITKNDIYCSADSTLPGRLAAVSTPEISYKKI